MRQAPERVRFPTFHVMDDPNTTEYRVRQQVGHRGIWYRRFDLVAKRWSQVVNQGALRWIHR